MGYREKGQIKKTLYFIILVFASGKNETAVEFANVLIKTSRHNKQKYFNFEVLFRLIYYRQKCLITFKILCSQFR